MIASRWTPDREVQLVDLVGQRLSGQKIARIMGISRNSVISKVSRMHMNLLGQSGHGGNKRARAVPEVKKPAYVAPLSPEAPPSLHIGMTELEHNHCRWPYGEGPYSFCGHPKVFGVPYCAFHRELSNGGNSYLMSQSKVVEGAQ